MRSAPEGQPTKHGDWEEGELSEGNGNEHDGTKSQTRKGKKVTVWKTEEATENK